MPFGLILILCFIIFGYAYTAIRKAIGKRCVRKAWAETEKVHQKAFDYVEKKYLK